MYVGRARRVYTENTCSRAGLFVWTQRICLTIPGTVLRPGTPHVHWARLNVRHHHTSPHPVGPLIANRVGLMKLVGP